MASVHPIMVSEATAAKMLDLSVSLFRQLVAAGLLPRGREIVPGLMRWNVEALWCVARGDLIGWQGDQEERR